MSPKKESSPRWNKPKPFIPIRTDGLHGERLSFVEHQERLDGRSQRQGLMRGLNGSQSNASGQSG